jgi:glucosamine 6-phosphate synthetase-like amidotransferase/phosphosugar isomerase protein
MCGIMGYYAFGRSLPDKNKITEMFQLLESRGRDASGYAYIENGQLKVNKAPIKSSELIKSSAWKTLPLPKIMILHTRMKTQGDPKNNSNNHPIFSKNGLAIVHNGMIYNDKEIFGKNKRDAEVDSEAILEVLTSYKKGDKIKRVFDRLEGSFAFALIDKNSPELLTLVKKDNPIELYFDTQSDILYFCSEKEIMQDALELKQSTLRGFNLGEGSFHHYSMGNNYSLIVNSEGVVSYKKYRSARERWDYRYDYHKPIEMDEAYIECPWCYSTTIYDGTKLNNQCEYCGNPLEEALYV